MNLPLVLPTDPPSWRHAVDAVIDAGFQPRRPANNQLKVGPYNFWPGTGAMTRDSMTGKKFTRRGLAGFLYLLQTSTTPLPRVTDHAKLLEPDAAAPITLSLDDLLGPDASIVPGEEAHGCQTAPGERDGPPGFDTRIDSLPQAMRSYARQLIDARKLAAQDADGATWIRYCEFVRAADLESETPF